MNNRRYNLVMQLKQAAEPGHPLQDMLIKAAKELETLDDRLMRIRTEVMLSQEDR